MRFSSRLASGASPNALALLLERKRASGASILDLTESNPTRAGIAFPPAYLESLADARAAVYDPQPFGLPSAREAIAAEFGDDRDRIFLTASTSEAYSWLFKLLCDPGDRILAPQPSYPLFQYLAALECVEDAGYPLFYDHGWCIDFHALELALTDRTRAVLVVHPNNPTGHFTRADEMAALDDICSRRGIAILVDEVFRDYELNRPAERPALWLTGNALTFRLNGLSKTAGLPQMKLAWTTVSGPDALTQAALERLETIADTYLSVGAPVQYALPRLLKLRQTAGERIRERLRKNLDALRGSGLRIYEPEGGWSAVVRLTNGAPEEDAALSLLRDSNVLVQPGYFYDFPQSGCLAVSLLTKPEVFARGLRAVSAL